MRAFLRESLSRLTDRFRRPALDAELAEELAFHRAQLERDARGEGADADAARRYASMRLGNATMVHEEARARWGWPWLERLRQDTAYALRSARRNPGYTLTVVLTLGLGIGANAVMFNVVDGTMYRPLYGLKDPAHTHRVYLQAMNRGELDTFGSFEYTRYLDLAKSPAFAVSAAFGERSMPIGRGPASREQRVGAVSASYFELFDVRPALGRFFTREEDRTPRGADVVVLSYPYWQSEYGGADVRGRTLQVGNISAQIIGVAPKGFAGVNDANPPAMWIPITTYGGSAGTDDARTYYTHYYWGWVNMLVLRRPEYSVEAATAAATREFERSWNLQRAEVPELTPVEAARPRATVGSVRPWAGPDPALEARTTLWVSGIAFVVLIIAGANVVNLTLARTLRRNRETAVRLALGAGRRRLVAQALTESTLLALAGAAVGLLIAHPGSRLLRSMLLTNVSDAGGSDLDIRTVLATTALALLTGVVTGIIPALLSGRGDLAHSLRGGSRGGTAHRTRLRSSLVVLQGALTVVLLIGAMLFVRSLQSVRDMRMGYDTAGIVRLNRIERGTPLSSAERVAVRERMIAVAQRHPAVEAVAWTNSTPFISTSQTHLFVKGIDSVPALGNFTYTVTTHDYFRTMGTRILQGRAFTEADRAGSVPVTVVSQSMARALWPGADPIGKCITPSADTMPCYQVVGVAEDMIQQDLLGDKRFHYYLPLPQFSRSQGNGMLVRLRGDVDVSAESLRAALQREMTGDSYVNVQRLDEIVGREQRSWRLGATLLLIFGALALTVASVGLFGMVAYEVAQRTHELGVRVALGATPRRILGMVLGGSTRLVIAGVAGGCAIAWALRSVVQPLLFRQSATDPLVFGLVGVLLLLVSLAASFLPARRAASSDPISALRAE